MKESGNNIAGESVEMEDSTAIDTLKVKQDVDGYITGELASWIEVAGFCVVITFFSVLITQLFVLYITIVDTLAPYVDW